MSGAVWLDLQCEERTGAFQVRHSLALSHDWTTAFGSSGSGKSTLLRLIAGLIPQRTGLLRIHADDLRMRPAWQRRIALVEQAPALFPHLTVAKNIAFGCRSWPGCVDYLKDLSRDMHLDALHDAMPAQLSGGERQRVAIARALGSAPRVLLLDEVFSGMDAPLRTELIHVMQQYSERLRMPIVSVTHDVAEVFATAQEVVRIAAGGIVAQGAPEAVLAGERQALLGALQPPLPARAD